MADNDVIVIGAGNGGLAAAACLAQKGVKTLLLERHNVPGGCATTFVRGRFEFEVALHQLSGLGSADKPGPLRDVLEKLDVLRKVEFLKEDTMYRLVIPNAFDITLKANKVEAVEALQKKFPAEASSIRNFFDFVWQFANEASCIYYLHDPEASKEKYPVFSKYALMNTQDVLDEYFRDPTLKAVISIYSGYAGLPPTKLPFMTMAGLIWIYGEFYPYYIKGGSQALSSAILDTFIKAGGRTKFSCAAKKLIVGEGRIRGVLTESGEVITAPCVVSNASVISSFVDLMDPEDVPAETWQMLGSRTIGPSAFNVYCGLDRSPEDLGIAVCSQFVVRAQPWGSSKLPASLAPPKGMLMTCYNLSDSDASPAGTSQVALCTLHYADDWISIPPAQYAETKYAYAEYMLELAEEACPGFRAAIEEVEVATPLTMMRFVGHPGGAIYGFDQYAKDSHIFVQPPQSIEGLYFAGCWVDTGGFQPTLESGVNAAEAIMQQIKF